MIERYAPAVEALNLPALSGAFFAQYGHRLWVQARYVEAIAAFERAIALCAAVGDAVNAAHAARDGQARAHCTLGIVLMRTRPAKVSEHAITEELRNGALEAQNLAGHRVLIVSHQIAHVFWIEVAGQRRRADQINEHYRELSTLGIGCRARLQVLICSLRRVAANVVGRRWNARHYGMFNNAAPKPLWA